MKKLTVTKILVLITVWSFTACGPMGSQMTPNNIRTGQFLPDYETQIEEEYEILTRKVEEALADAKKRKAEAEKSQTTAELEYIEAEQAEELAKKEQAEAEAAEKAAEEEAQKTEDSEKKAEAEARRVEAEAKKKKAEAERLAAEKKKKEADEKKKQAEEERHAAEEAGKKAEEDLAEINRKKQEALEGEKQRKEKAEADRIAAEKKAEEEKKKNGGKTPPQSIPPTNVRADTSDFTKLVWEKDRHIGPQAKEWTKMVYATIEQEEPQLLSQNPAKDIERFCPKFRSMTDAQRLNFWGQLIAAMALPESSWRPTTQMVETTMGKDPVTQQQVKSEGLLQLSYQDERNYRINCGFDWNKDKLLPAKDPRRTILNPYLNLRCGIKILAIQLKNRGAIALEKNVYWAVLRINGKYSKIAQISATTRAVKGCQ